MTDNAKPTLILDIEKYQHYLDHCDLTPEEGEEFLQTIWNMVCEFVLLGFNVHPLQDLTGDKAADSAALSTLLSNDMLSSIDAAAQEKGTE